MVAIPLISAGLCEPRKDTIWATRVFPILVLIQLCVCWAPCNTPVAEAGTLQAEPAVSSINTKLSLRLVRSPDLYQDAPVRLPVSGA